MWTHVVIPEELCKNTRLVFYMGVLDLPKVSDMWRVKVYSTSAFYHKLMSRGNVPHYNLQ